MGLAVAFGLAYTQNPLYSANQNSYFLHGLKTSVLPLLAGDWMANTVDPFPLFSWLVRLTSSTLSPYTFYVYQALLLGVYITALLGIACKTFDIPYASTQFLFCFLLLAGLHSAALADLSLSVFGKNVVQLIDSGLAQQSVLGHELLPSTFGVLLIVSIFAFVAGRPLAAVILSSMAAAFHSSYILSSAILTLIYAVLIFRETDGRRKALLTGLLGFLLLLPSVLYIYTFFQPTSPELFSRSQSILVHFRIPRHADPRTWSVLQTVGIVTIILSGLYLARGKKVFPVTLLAFIAGLILTFVQIVTANETLALLFPWRISAWLAPISWGLVLAGLTKVVFARGSWLPRSVSKFSPLRLTILISILLLAVYGTWKMSVRPQDGSPPSTMENMMQYVSAAAAPKQVYLVPAEMEQFRLKTGVPILVDWKTHPYKDAEVIEWYRRLLDARKFYASMPDSGREVLHDMQRRYDVTHVVLPGRPGPTAFPGLREVYHDSAYAVFEISD